MTRPSQYRGYRLPPEIISYSVWLYDRFTVRYRDVEELFAERGIASYETVRRWCLRFGPRYARNLRRQSANRGDTWLIDEVFVSIRGHRHYRWRAIDQDGDVIKGQQSSPNRLVTDKLGSYRVAHREQMPMVPHDTTKYANNRTEASHRATREQERQIKGFQSIANMQRFLILHAMIRNLINWSRHALKASVYRRFRSMLSDRGFCLPAVR